MSLWKFGNDSDGLLVVEADSEVAAIERRDAYLTEQRELLALDTEWWAKVQRPGEDYWDVRRGFGVDGLARAIAKFGPRPSDYHPYSALTDGPELLADGVFFYQWME